MSRSPAAAGAAAVLLLVATLVCLLVLQMGGYDQDLWFSVFWAALAVAAVLVTVRSMLKRDFGSALAWAYIALPIIAVLVGMAFSLIHVGRLLDPMACRDYGDCGPSVPIVAWFCLSLSVGAGVALLVAVGRSRALRGPAPD